MPQSPPPAADPRITMAEIAPDLKFRSEMTTILHFLTKQIKIELGRAQAQDHPAICLNASGIACQP
jgi:hypothetical protein